MCIWYMVVLALLFFRRLSPCLSELFSLNIASIWKNTIKKSVTYSITPHHGILPRPIVRMDGMGCGDC